MPGPQFQGGPHLPLSAVVDTKSGGSISGILWSKGEAMVAGIRTVKLNAQQAFRTTNYVVTPVLEVASDTAAAQQTFHVNKVSATEFHIVSDDNTSVSLVGYIAIGD